MRRSRFLVGSAITATAGVLPSIADARAAQTILDQYVAAPDPEYHYTLLDTIVSETHTGYVLEMTSQRWRTTADVDRPVWKHWLTIVRPHDVATNVSALVIGGGSNNDAPPRKIDPLLAFLALRTGSVVSEVKMVPNQPLAFHGDGTPLSEDALVAYTWDRFLRSGDPSWPLRLPMTKSVVRAMDTITEFCARDGGGVRVDRFVVGGSSKRGWTTWTTAAVDERVAGAIPIVLDMLNVAMSAPHEYRSYGFWSPALHDYERMGIMRWIGTPQLDALLQIEDPYSYRDRLTMPKFIINATGDQYFVPDSSQYYFPGLPGEKYLRYVPNTDHSLSGAASDAAHSVLAFYRSIIAGAARPSLSWRFEDNGGIRVDTVTRPSSVTLWQAHNPNARDFRLETIGKAFTSTPLHDHGGGTYVSALARPPRGWSAYFVEVVYPATDDDAFKVTTGVRVTPDVLPFDAPSNS